VATGFKLKAEISKPHISPPVPPFDKLRTGFDWLRVTRDAEVRREKDALKFKEQNHLSSAFSTALCVSSDQRERA